MKVIIPVLNDGDSKFILAEGFHNADYACIYDRENNSYTWEATSNISEKSGNLSVELKRRGIFAVISSYMPPLALELFRELGLQVYKSSGLNLRENIDNFLNEQLKELTPLMAFSSSSCHGSCNSCGSSCN